MTKLEFTIREAIAEPHPATPALRLRLNLRSSGEAIDAIAVRARVQIEPWRRRYAPGEEALLSDLSPTAALQWAETSLVLPGFDGETLFDVTLACTYDLQVAAAKYLTALADGAIPVRLFFNGTIFRGAPAGFNVEMLPWDLECAGDIPIATWQRAMDACFAGQAWIRIDRSTFDALRRFRAAHHCASWDDAVNAMLAVET